jgi:hypothetical protein
MDDSPATVLDSERTDPWGQFSRPIIHRGPASVADPEGQVSGCVWTLGRDAQPVRVDSPGGRVRCSVSGWAPHPDRCAASTLLEAHVEPLALD